MLYGIPCYMAYICDVAYVLYTSWNAVYIRLKLKVNSFTKHLSVLISTRRLNFLADISLY